MVYIVRLKYSIYTRFTGIGARNKLYGYVKISTTL